MFDQRPTTGVISLAIAWFEFAELGRALMHAAFIAALSHLGKQNSAPE